MKGTPFLLPLGILIIFLIFWSCDLQAQTVPDSARRHAFFETLADYQSDLDSLMQEISVPGAAVAIVSRDSIVHLGTYGLADVKAGQPVTETTHFCLGSCTKSFTGLALLKLAGKGRIDLNTPVREIAPEIEIENPWKDVHPVRVIHLLEHTAGFEDSHINWFYFQGPALTLRQALGAKTHLHKVYWPPGTRFCYSSVGFTIAGYIIEKVSGRQYGDYMQEALLEPIGMTSSTVGSSEESRRLLATGYDKHSRPFPRWYDYDEPAGAMNASIEEMARFIQFMLHRGAVGEKRIIAADLFDRIGRPTTTLAAQAGLATGYSFGIGTNYKNGAKWYGHGGAVPGFVAEYAYNLDLGIGFVVLQNSFDLTFNDALFYRTWRFMNSLADDGISPPAASSPQDLEQYCGYYEPRNPRMQLAAFAEILAGGVTIECRQDTLFSRGFMDTERPLIAVAEHLFRRPTDAEASRVFLTTPDGRMAFASPGSYYERTSIWRARAHRIFFFGALMIMFSALVYFTFWLPVHVYKWLKHNENRSNYVRMRVVPLVAVGSLVLGILAIFLADQTILELGKRTPANVVFFFSTLAFAVFSALSIVTTAASYTKPVRRMARYYATVLSAACVGMALYLGTYGLIGLRLWAY
jgi:CubicO group peptidase (beta-lactamase class C family)